MDFAIGQQADLRIQLEDAPGVAAASLEITFDPDVVEIFDQDLEQPGVQFGLGPGWLAAQAEENDVDTLEGIITIDFVRTLTETQALSPSLPLTGTLPTDIIAQGRILGIRAGISEFTIEWAELITFEDQPLTPTLVNCFANVGNSGQPTPTPTPLSGQPQPTSELATPTPTVSSPLSTPTPTFTWTPEPTPTFTDTPTWTPTATPTEAPTDTPTPTPTALEVASPTPEETAGLTETPVTSPLETPTPTDTPTPTWTPVPPTDTPTSTWTPTDTPTPVPPTATPTFTATPTETPTPLVLVVTPTVMPTPVPSTPEAEALPLVAVDQPPPTGPILDPGGLVVLGWLSLAGALVLAVAGWHLWRSR